MFEQDYNTLKKAFFKVTYNLYFAFWMNKLHKIEF